MVINSSEGTFARLGVLSKLIWLYVAIVAATIVALIILTVVAPAAATSEAWGHVVIVALFAVLLPLRLRSARRGNARAVSAVAIIATVLLVVNVVEAFIPGLFPVWMRIEMLATAALMAAIAVLAFRARK